MAAQTGPAIAQERSKGRGTDSPEEMAQRDLDDRAFADAMPGCQLSQFCSNVRGQIDGKALGIMRIPDPLRERRLALFRASLSNHGPSLQVVSSAPKEAAGPEISDKVRT